MHRIRKASGEYEEYDREKLVSSLISSGLSKEEAEKVILRIESLGKVESTKEIYDAVRKILLKTYPVAAAKYSMKEAIVKLGPTGFPFEKYVARILKALGHEVETNRLIKGKCVTHEIDLWIDGSRIGECKYHNAKGIYTGLKEAMYTYMRFLDIGEVKELEGVTLITNTKFSSEAIEFSKCYGLDLLGWKYPPGRGLEVLVEDSGVYPVTVLEGILEYDEVKSLVAMGVITVDQLVEGRKIDERAYRIVMELINLSKARERNSLTKGSYQ